ncbi:hypothetical protein BJ875DRAFT_150066 [Amylocarpus encephaloides]|uniref:Uncharacterized protein n=1 Tax=Amylocarpus encephaloides TaxID=45428 RepID=A0A9P7YCD3_9HELO|nr:hypothetical protein BJ875DRAFT_150066 [Amylocarpus encephaloides]
MDLVTGLATKLGYGLNNSGRDKDLNKYEGLNRNEGFGPEDYTHPEKFYPGLVWSPDSFAPESVRKIRSQLDPMIGRSEDQELCWSCGWSNQHQLFSSYVLE